MTRRMPAKNIGPRAVRALGIALLVLVLVRPAAGEVVNRIVATVDGDPVTLIELQQFMARMQKAPPGTVPQATDQRAMLDELVLDKIVRKEIAAQGLVATDQQIDAYIRSIRERNNLSEEQLQEALKTQGLTWEQYREQVRTDIERANLINKEIRSKVTVSPEEIERYRAAHPDEVGDTTGTATKNAKARTRLISLLVPAGSDDAARAAVKAKAEAVRAEAAADPDDFADLAKEHSEGPGAAEGGDLGDIAPSDMQAEFAAAASALGPGEVSALIETGTGYHILMIEAPADAEAADAEAAKLTDQQTEQIREKLYRQAVEERYDRWLKQDLRARHHVELFL